MSTTQVAATLFRLQEIDLELDRLKSEHQTVNSALQGDIRLRRLRLDYDATQQQWEASVQAHKDIAWSLEHTNQLLSQHEKRFQSGSLSKPEEIEAIRRELQNLRAQQSRQEQQLHAIIDVEDSLKEAVDQKLKALHQFESLWQDEFTVLRQRCSHIEEQQNQLFTQREQLITQLNGHLVQRYDSMRRSKQGRAVSRVERNACQWCLAIITASELHQAVISEELQTCTNCGRILYYEPVAL